MLLSKICGFDQKLRLIQNIRIINMLFVSLLNDTVKLNLHSLMKVDKCNKQVNSIGMIINKINVNSLH